MGCSDPAKDVGNDPLDNALVSADPRTAWIGTAFGEPEATIADLFDESITFEVSPDPTPLFNSTRGTHQDLPELTDTTNLKILTWNAGLLSRSYLGGHVEVPHIDERRAVIPDRLANGGFDVIFLQEVWEWSDVEAIGAALETAGYTWYAGSESTHEETGVMLAVRTSLIGTGAPIQEEFQYAAQRKLENFPGPNLKRGWIHWSFVLAGSSQRVDLFDTHLTPFYDRWNTRDLQVRELGLSVRQVPADALVFIGGDLNAGPYYAADVWVDGEGAEHPGWWPNTMMWGLVQYYADVADLVGAAALHQDKTRGDTVPQGGGASFLETPFGNAAWCTDNADTFTATDCNRLSFASYAGQEFPSRLDHLFFRDPGQKLRATGTRLEYVAPETLGEVTTELSDHYGVSVDIRIAL